MRFPSAGFPGTPQSAGPEGPRFEKGGHGGGARRYHRAAMSDGQQFPCPSCGAPNMSFDPQRQAMACPYCGHVAAVQPQQQAAPQQQAGPQEQAAPQQGAPQAEGQAAQGGFGTPAGGGQAPAPAPGGERSLQEGLQMEQSQGGQGYGTQVRTLDCSTCGATVNFAGGEISSKCAFCGSQSVIEQQAHGNVIRPESLVPFAVNQEAAKQKFQEWLGSGFFRPGDLEDAARVEGGIAGMYVPYWTFDCAVQSQWRAEAGHHYYEHELVTKVVDGQKQQVKERVRKTRWEPAHGHRQDRYDDVLVVASKGLPEKIADRLATFDTSALQPYDPRFLAGYRAEEYGVGLADGWEKAKRKVIADQDRKCQSDIPGDTHRNYQSQHQFGQETYKHILLPLWIAAYRYQDETYRFLVNGQTGEVQGEAPTSWFKVALVVLVIAAIIAGIVFAVKAGKG